MKFRIGEGQGEEGGGRGREEGNLKRLLINLATKKKKKNK